MPVIDYIVFRRQISAERFPFLVGEVNAGLKIVGYVWIAAIFSNFSGSHLLLLELVVEICGSGTRYESGKRILLWKLREFVAPACRSADRMGRSMSTGSKQSKSTKPDLFWRSKEIETRAMLLLRH